MIKIGTGESNLIRFRTDLFGMVTDFSMPRYSDWHAHFRRKEMMEVVTKEIVRHLRYALAMPNNGPIRTMEEAEEYYDDLKYLINNMKEAREIEHVVDLVMTLYHTADITAPVIEKIARSKIVRAVKHYPPHPGATTGSGHGVPIWDSPDMLYAMEANGVPLLGHFESVVDERGRPLRAEEGEEHFVKAHLWRLRDRYPRLRICCEHTTTVAMVEFVKADTSGNTVLTATPHHMLFTTPDLDRLSWGAHLRCKPIVQSEANRAAVEHFVTSGDPRAILGSDIAPHPRKAKEVSPPESPAYGCYLPHALALYAYVFERAGALDDRFVQFASYNGCDWWGVPRPSATDRITIRAAAVSEDIPAPTDIPGAGDIIIPLGWTPNPDAFHPGVLCQGAAEI